MGTKQGTFKTYDGDTISVVFQGENITSAKLKLAASPVVLQMDGAGHDYNPVQYTTASITCISDGVELIDLYSGIPLDVSVEIVNTSTGDILFAGYVTPNMFSQSIDGVCDSVTIECVDWLGIAKYVPYQPVNAGFPLETRTVAEILWHIVGLLQSSPVRILLSDYIRISDRNIDYIDDVTRETNEYFRLKVSESYFFNNPTTPDFVGGTISLSKQAKSTFEVLAMIAESFRGSFYAEGYTLVFNDVISQLEDREAFIDIGTNETVTMGDAVTINEELFSSSGNTVSVLRDYDSFSLVRKKADTIISCDFLQGYVTPNGKRFVEAETKEGNMTTRVLVQNLSSEMFYTNIPSSNASSDNSPIASLWGYKEFKQRFDLKYLPHWDESWENYIRACLTGASQTQLRVALKHDYIMPVVQCKAFAVSLKMKVAKSSDRNTVAPTNLDSDLDPMDMGLSLKIGNKYYNASSGTWGNASRWNDIQALDSQKTGWHDVFFVVDNQPADYIFAETQDGRLVVDFIFSNPYAVVYIKDIEFSIHQTWEYNKPRPAVTYKGNPYSANAFDSVELPITFGLPKTEKSFSGTIDDVVYVSTLNNLASGDCWARGAMDFYYINRDGEKIVHTTLDRIEAMATHGDGKEYQLNLKDSHNRLSVFDTFTSPLWSGRKVVCAFQKDIERNTANITLA